MNRRRHWVCTSLALVLLAVVFFASGCARQPNNQPANAAEITVAAAANLTEVFAEIARPFSAQTGIRVTFRS